MKLFSTLLVSILFSINLMALNDILIIEKSDSLNVFSEPIKEIKIESGFFKIDRSTMNKMIIDSVEYYGGNVFKITDIKEYETSFISKPVEYLSGSIYKIQNDYKESLASKIKRKKERKDSILKSRKKYKDFELSFGMQMFQYQMELNEGYINNNSENTGYSGNFFFNINYVIPSNWTNNFQYRIGIGLAREFTSFHPGITLNDAKISNIDTIIIGEVGNMEYLFLLPIGLSYDFGNIIENHHGYFGFRINLGIENRFRVNRVNTDVILVENYDKDENFGLVVNYEEYEELSKEKYSDFIGNYSFQANIGIEILTPSIGSVGLKYINFLSHPFRYDQRLFNQSGYLIYLNFQLFDI